LQGRRDEAPNQELARALAEQDDRDGIQKLVANLHHTDQDVRCDCLTRLYEVGHLKPELVADYAGEFLRLLRDRNNRMIWGAMLVLSTIAPLRADELYLHRQRIQDGMAEGSVIEVDNGVKVLAAVAAANETYRAELLPYLLQHLRTCRPKDVLRIRPPGQPICRSPAPGVGHPGGILRALALAPRAGFGPRPQRLQKPLPAGANVVPPHLPGANDAVG